MKYLDLSLAEPEANLACDEALLDWCESGAGTPVLRFWSSREVFVVVGYSKAVEREVHVKRCQTQGVPILRRCTGGGTVVQGPGCFNYALVLRIADAPELQTIPGTNRFVMERQRAAVQTLTESNVRVEGHTDLSLARRKFSGNAQRRRREYLLFHGSFLLGFDLELIEELLPAPATQPEYRGQRSHRNFLVNLTVPALRLKEALQKAWQAFEPLTLWPEAETQRLSLQRYRTREWNCKF